MKEVVKRSRPVAETPVRVNDDWYLLVGTSHVAKSAVKKVRSSFKEFNPDVVAVELDPQRLQALLTDAKRSSFLSMVGAVGVRGAFFALIGGALQRKLGAILKMVPGADMLAAVKEAQHHERRVLLIDRDLRITLHRLGKSLGWREFRQAVKELFKREKLSFKLSDVPSEELVSKLLVEFKHRYPRPYKALVSERNTHMVVALLNYHKARPSDRLLVVVGAGHLEGMRSLLKKRIEQDPLQKT